MSPLDNAGIDLMTSPVGAAGLWCWRRSASTLFHDLDSAPAWPRPDARTPSIEREVTS